MTNCQKCGAPVSLPYVCRRCQNQYCAKHRLPESHDCTGLYEGPREEYLSKKRREVVPRSSARELEDSNVRGDFRDPEFNVVYSYTDEASFDRQYALRKSRARFSGTEAKHLLIALGLLTLLSLSVFLNFPFLYFAYFDPVQFILLTLILFLSFLPHELMHKVTAQRFGLFAEFRIIPYYVMLTLVFILLSPFKLYAPGAVMIGGEANPSQFGKTAAAGPATNLVIGSAMLGLALILPYRTVLLLTGAQLSGWLALFNMFPVQPLDGEKILHWNRIAFSALLVGSLLLLLLPGIL